MITIKVLNEKQIINGVDRTLRSQVPAAIAKGLTRTAFDARDYITAALPKRLDRPTPFTMRAIAIKRAYAKQRTAYVYVRPLQERYLIYQILGGSSSRRKVVPSKSWPKNAYGNLARGTTKRAKTYRVKVKGRDTYWKDKGRGAVDQMIGFVPAVRSYRRRFPYYNLGELSVRRTLPRQVYREVLKIPGITRI